MKRAANYLAETLADVQAIRTRQRDEVESAMNLTAEIGARVWVIRKGLYFGMAGVVLAKWFAGDVWKVRVDLGKKVVQLYARSVSREPDGIDCAAAEIQLSACRVKYVSGNFLD